MASQSSRCVHRAMQVFVLPVFFFLFQVPHAGADQGALRTGSSPAGEPRVWREQGLGGWNILAERSAAPPLPGLALEWDYFMIHDRQGKFTGSIGYVVADPAGRLGGRDKWIGLMPSGGSVAIAGRTASGHKVGEYYHFGLQETMAGLHNKSFSARSADRSHADLVPLPAAANGRPQRLQLSGRTHAASWELEISPDWWEHADAYAASASKAFQPASASDMGVLANERWTVHMVWPRTKVRGWIVLHETGERIEVDGHGYRENSWGYWDMITDGWDFAVVSDEHTKVQWAFQTYHRSKALDLLDVGYVKDGKVHAEHFSARDGELSWSHGDWTFDSEARQCVPRDLTVVGRNARVTVEAKVDIGDEWTSILSNATVLTRLFVIVAQFPTVSGTIKDNVSGGILSTFSGQAGGEFAVARSLRQRIDERECQRLGKENFSMPFVRPQR